MSKKKHSFKGEGFLEMALVLILVAIVMIGILALLGPEISAWVEDLLG